MISEKTDEEKLRQELEGGLSVKKPSSSASKKKNSSSRSKNSRRKNLSDTMDSFMEDFERKIGNVPKEIPTAKPEASISDLEELLTPSPLPEEIQVVPEQEVLIEEEAEPAEPQSEELPDIPILEEESPDLPEIPVILPDEGDEDFEDIIADEPIEPVEPVEAVEPVETEEPEVDDMPELQETELVEAQEPEDEFADLPEIPEEEEEADEPPTLDFAPSADVVVNVDDVIPEIQNDDETPVDPESEAAPITVTMPESTKTAEDKLMADIAEAMTGNPLSLETNDAQALYNLPENFLADAPSQSAEDKLKANIAQALSESPIAAAQSQSQQDLEQDLNPFDEISIPNFEEITEPVEVPEAVEEEEEAPEEPEAVEEPEEPEEPFDVPVDDEANEEQEDSPFDVDVAEDTLEDTVIEPEPEFEPEPEPEPEPEVEETLNDEDPFQLTEEPESEPEPEHEEPPQDINNDFADLPFSLGDDEEHEEQPELEVPEVKEEPQTITEPATELEALSQFVNTNLNEEAVTETKMPDETLLEDEVETETETNDDDWDMSSLGVLSEATTIPDDEPEHSFSLPTTVTEMITQPESEDDHKEKTMGIREKLALRKNAASDEKPTKKKSSSSGNSSGGFFMPFVLTLLLIVGSLILWQLTQMSNKLTALALNSPGGFESVTVTEAPRPSYDYAIDFILDPNLTERMSQRGRDGWQVVGSRRTQDSTTGQYGYEFIFMRRTPGR